MYVHYVYTYTTYIVMHIYLSLIYQTTCSSYKWKYGKYDELVLRAPFRCFTYNKSSYSCHSLGPRQKRCQVVNRQVGIYFCTQFRCFYSFVCNLWRFCWASIWSTWDCRRANLCRRGGWAGGYAPLACQSSAADLFNIHFLYEMLIKVGKTIIMVSEVLPLYH